MADHLARGHHVKPGVYASAGVMVLYNASCVERGSLFRFHSAFYTLTMEPSAVGNEVMIHKLSQWPRLVQYLWEKGAFSSLEFTDMNSEEISYYGGVPLCGSN